MLRTWLAIVVLATAIVALAAVIYRWTLPSNVDWTATGGFVKDIGGTLVAIIAVVFAGITTVVGLRERTKDYRQHLYEQQLANAVDLIGAAQALLRRVDEAVMLDRLRAIDLEVTPEEGWADVAEARLALRLVERRSTALLPVATLSALAEYHRRLGAVAAFEGTPTGKYLRRAETVDPANMMAFSEAFGALVATARGDMHIGPLTRQILGLIGRSGAGLEHIPS